MFVRSRPPFGRKGLSERRLFFVFIAGLALGLLGLLFNARAIWVLRSTPTIFPLGPRNLFSAVVWLLLVAAALVAPSYEGALNHIRRLAEAILSWDLSWVSPWLWWILTRLAWIPTCFGLKKASLVGEVSNAYFLSPSCLFLHALLFGVATGLVSL